MAAATEQTMPTSQTGAAVPVAQRFSRLALTAMVVESMVGAGIFSLPGRFGAATGPFGALIAWASSPSATSRLGCCRACLAIRAS